VPTKARQLIASGSFGPDQLKALFKAFDEAWDAIAPTVSGRAAAVEVARVRLANIVLSLAPRGTGAGGQIDAEQVRDAAIRIFKAGGGSDT
jgi:hypothetical protein